MRHWLAASDTKEMKRLLIVIVALSAGCRCVHHQPPAVTQAVIATTESGPTTESSTPVMSIDNAMKLIDARDDWHDFPPITVPRHPSEKYLKGLIIVLDPGHGGKDHNGKGPTGILEADMNLRVGLLLARLLGDAGANVTLTRNNDSFLELADRAKIANTIKRPDGGVGADLFISLHHNSTQSRTTNWTSVWYHGQIDNAEVSLDAARFVAMDLNKAVPPPTLRSPRRFSVINSCIPAGLGCCACTVPCFLCESSFYSNPIEERRLADAGYNLREAYAIYTGLCEWANVAGQRKPPQRQTRRRKPRRRLPRTVRRVTSNPRSAKVCPTGGARIAAGFWIRASP